MISPSSSHQRGMKWVAALVAAGAFCASFLAQAATAPVKKNDRGQGTEETLLDPAKAPTPAEWRRFMEMPAGEAEALWLASAHRGTTLAAWDWKWRLGWVRTCSGENALKLDFCRGLLENALEDKALVVRAESAAALGSAFEGSMDVTASRKLLGALRDGRNLRSGTPVMVQKRALYSILKIGHADSVKEAGKVAERHPELKSYWEKLTST